MRTHLPHHPHQDHPFLRFAIDHPQADSWLLLAFITLAALVMWLLNS